MDRYAIVKDGVVVNVIEYENDPGNTPPGFDEGYFAVKDSTCNPGWHYINGQFVDPNPQEPVNPPIVNTVSLTDAILSNPTELAKLKTALGLT